MIICHTHKWIYVAPPKTGSTTCYVFLTQPALFDPNVDISTRKQIGGIHNFDIPREHKHYFTIVSRRDTVNRLVSLWINHTLSCYNKGYGLLKFDEFLIWRKTKSDRLIMLDQELFHPDRIDYWVNTETIEKDLMSLPFVKNCTKPIQPVQWRTKRNSELFYKTAKEFDLL